MGGSVDCSGIPPAGSGGAEGLGGLFCIKVGKDPVKPEGNGVDDDGGNKGEGYSGKFGVEVFRGSVVNGGLKVGYCSEGGIGNPCGGLGSDCWWTFGGGA